MSDLFAIIITIGFVFSGLILIIVSKKYFNIGDTGLSITLLIVPTAIYLLLSGKILEFEGYGIKASFQTLANTEISSSRISIDTITPESTSLEAITEVESAKILLGGSDYVVFIRSDHQYSREARAAKAGLIKSGITSGLLKFVIVIDERSRPLGYFRPHIFLDLVHLQFQFAGYPNAGEYDVEAMYRGMIQTTFWDIMENPERRAADWGERLFISQTETLANAFQILFQENSPGALVTNLRGEYRDFVMMDSVVKEITLAFLTAAESTE